MGRQSQLSIHHGTPRHDILESLCETRIRGSDQLKTVSALCEEDIEQLIHNRTARNLKTMVKRCLDRRSEPEILRPEMKESRQEHRRKAKGNLSAFKGKQGECYQCKRTVHKRRRL